MSVPECPEGHASKSVVRAGWYGGGAGRKVRRQRWKCTPKKGAPHRFAETLPRLVEVAHRRVCDQCATTLEPWEGQPAPRLYEFTARQVAHALALVHPRRYVEWVEWGLGLCGGEPSARAHGESESDG